MMMMMLMVNASPMSETDATRTMSSADVSEILAPPMVVLLAGYLALLGLWFKSHGKELVRYLLPDCVGSKSTVDVLDIPLDQEKYQDKTLQPLLTDSDEQILKAIGRNTNTLKELTKIVIPATLSLGFCPLTLFTHKWIVQGFWPTEEFPKPPNVNDGIACFLVPAGMVYAISFGFAFQAVFTKHMDTDRCFSEEVNDLNRIISLICRMSVSTLNTRLLILRMVKDEVISVIQDALILKKPQDYDAQKESFQDIIQLLTSDPAALTTSNDVTLRKQVIKLISSRVYRVELKCPHTQRLHPVMWAFLETLGYFTFMALLLVRTQSYRLDLSFCIITVISISMLCYIVADLDSPFNGFFRVNIGVLPSVIRRLDVIYRNYVINMHDVRREVTKK